MSSTSASTLSVKLSSISSLAASGKKLTVLSGFKQVFLFENAAKCAEAVAALSTEAGLPCATTADLPPSVPAAFGCLQRGDTEAFVAELAEGGCHRGRILG